MTKAEEIYHRFVQYEWNEIGEGMKKSILDAINEALRQPPVIGSVCDGCGSKFDAMDISVGVCYCCQKEIKQTDL